MRQDGEAAPNEGTAEVKGLFAAKPIAWIRDRTRAFGASRAGNIAVYFALSSLPLLAGIALAVDYADALNKKSELQSYLDGAVLTGAADAQDPTGAAKNFFMQTTGMSAEDYADLSGKGRIKFVLNDNTLAGTVTQTFARPIQSVVGGSHVDISVAAQVRLRKSAAQGPCITVLANSGQALLLNSGAKMDAPDCEVHVHSTKDPAFIMNAGVDLKIAKLCVKGTKYIKNGGTVTKLETGCTVASDPYFGKIAEPTVPTNCQTSGAKDGTTHTLNPGAHCWVNFNGNPTITFKPGLHIIRGSMNINNGSTVNAEGVTFYFPDRDSKIQANGALTMKATAPTSGTYKGILMFEKWSDAASNPWTTQYVFNGSKSEYLGGAIYLPFRDVTYNSTTNVSGSKISMVVNTLIVNSANWKYEGLSSGGGKTSFYLSR